MSTRVGLRCHEHISGGLFKGCVHFELSTGATLELRFAPSYTDHAMDLILWDRLEDPARPALRTGRTAAADSLVKAFCALTFSLGESLVFLESPTDAAARERVYENQREIDRIVDSVVMGKWGEIGGDWDAGEAGTAGVRFGLRPGLRLGDSNE